MKKKFTFLMALFALMLITLPGMVKGQSYEEVLTLNCAYASENGSQSLYGVNNSTVMAAAGVKTFLKVAANESTTTGSDIVNSDPTVSGSVYWAKGSGGSGIPDNVLKIGKASGPGSISFTLVNTYDEIKKVSIKGYGWKTSTAVSVNSSTSQSPTTAALEVTFNYVLSSATRSITISVASSAFCATEIVLYKEVTTPTPAISVSPATIDAPYTGSANTGYESGALTLTTNVSGTNPNVYSAVYSDTENGSYTTTIPEMMGTTGAWVVYQNNAFKVGWNVEANETQSTRECYFKIKYGTDTYSNAVHVSQAAAPAPSYSITLTGGNTITADYAGNVTSGGDIMVSTNLTPNLGYAVYYKNGDIYTSANPYDWFEADVNSSNVIECEIAQNSTGANRTAQFKLYTTDDTNEAWSEVVTLTQGYVAAPTFDPNGATFHGTQSVALASETTGASIRYTLDGSTPSATTGEVYTNGTPFSLTATKTVKAIAYVTVSNVNITSAVSEATFTQEQVATPTFTPNGGPVMSGTTVSINCETTGADIQYSTNGDDYSAYSGPIEITVNTTLYAKATADGYANSAIASASFTVAEIHTVAWAIANTPSSGTSSNYYIHGIVSSLQGSTILDDGSNYRYYVSDDGTTSTQLLVYKGKDLGNVTFSNADDLLVGDEVVIYGGLTTYNSTKEVASGNYLVSKIRRPSISAENVNLAASATSGEINYTLNANGTTGTLSVSEDVDWITAATLNTTDNKVELTTTANSGAERSGNVTITYTYNNNETVSKNVTVTQAEYVAPSEWVLTDFDDLTSADVFVIVGTYVNNTYALPNNNGSSAPTATSVIIENDKLKAAPATTLQWTLVGNETDGYMFYPKGSTTTYLYCTNSNNGVKVNSTTEADMGKHFTLDDSGYLTTTETTDQRYLGIYNGSDWRTYTSTTGNIKDETFAFYRRVTDPVTYTKTIEPCTADGGYYLIAPSVASVTPSADNGFITNPNRYDLYYFDQSSETEWMNYKQSAFNLVSGKGYLYANEATTTLTFTGQPYNGNGIVALAYDENARFEGCNLIGNPYPTTAYLTDNSFYRMNADGDNIIVESSNFAINQMEGVIVEATTTKRQVVFTTTAPINKASVSRIVLNVIGKSDNVIDRAIVRFAEDGTLSKYMINESSTNISIPQNDAKYAVVCSDGKASMPVNFKAAETGKYTISVNAEGLDMDYLHLIDRLTGEDVNLLIEDSYSFIASKQDPESRFIISFTANGYNNEADATFAYQNGNEVIVNGEGELQIFDVMGRRVMTMNINGVETISGLANGVYVFRMEGKTQKIVVR